MTHIIVRRKQDRPKPEELPAMSKAELDRQKNREIAQIIQDRKKVWRKERGIGVY